MNRFFSTVTVSGLLYLGLAFATVHAGESDFETIRKQYIEHIIGSPKAETIATFQKTLSKDGTWPDINYKDNKRSGWEPIRHVGRLRDMARAYRKPDHPLYLDKVLLSDIVRGLKHYLSGKYKCPNWWYNKIGVPQKAADLLLLMGNDLPKDVADQAIKDIVAQAKIGMTGQNKVWLAEIVLVRSLYEKDETALKKARNVILSEVRVTTKEGVQPDWSFHQHGPQQQFGNYGGAFASSVLKWAQILNGTSLALSEKERDVIRNYVLHGTSWVTWKGRLDLSACGRQVYNDCQIRKGRGVIRQLESLAKIDPENKRMYDFHLAGNDEAGVNTLVANKHFWRSDMMVHRRATWYASVKMSSKRVIGSETCNSENMLGRNLGNGTLFVYRTGDEYRNIQPVWDWRRLPGTTTDQSIKSLVPSKGACRPPVAFVGGVSDIHCGVAVFDFRQGSLTARKAWFFEKDRIICLGARISSEKGGKILTSVEQSLLVDTVTGNTGPFAKGTHSLKPGDWVLNGQIGYQIFKGPNPTLSIAEQTGNWRQIYTTRGDQTELSMDVFNVWFDHGKTPDSSSYAYAVFPNVSRFEMEALTAKSSASILRNTSAVQAITSNGGSHVRAAFYDAGTLEYGAGKTITTDTPCLLTIDVAKKTLYVADPTQEKKQLKLTINGTEQVVDLPKGGSAGKSVAVAVK